MNLHTQGCSSKPTGEGGGFYRTDSTTEADTDEAESSASKEAIDSF